MQHIWLLRGDEDDGESAGRGKADGVIDAALVPPEVDLRSFEWMPYFGARLGGSEFNARASDEVFRAAHRLWWAAWHQVPCSSLPDDDVALARFADFGKDVKAWRKIKEAVLHGFVKCADGRLYHRFLAKEALKAWASKQASDVEREKGRLRLKEWRSKKDEHASRKGDGNADETRFKDVTEPIQNGDGTVLTLPNTTLPGSKISEANASAPPALVADGPLDLKREMWRIGKGFLSGQGVPEKQIGTLLGSWRRDFGDANVIQALAAAEAECASEPIEFIVACLRRQGNGSRKPAGSRQDDIVTAFAAAVGIRK